MDVDKKWIVVVYGAILSVLGSMVTAMLSREPNIWTRVKTFIAGVSCGIMLQIIFMDFNWSQGYKNVIATASAAFVSTIWPTLGSFYDKFLKKKLNDDTISATKRD